MDWTTLATVAQVAVERVDSDSDEEEFDDIVAMLAVKLVYVAESSAHACIDRVLNLLQSMSEEVITWPDQQQQERIKAGFLAKSAAVALSFYDGLDHVATVAQVAVERVDSDSDEEEFDDIVAMLAVKLVRTDRNRIPRCSINPKETCHMG
ncbi:hypothetical protein HPB52_023698 [Rhipicephalus sanguineus]|uniref:Uncharacterized protein n=1 Tax=Rhipicephalus sanguineus TaxID=34632 RepID=A0A9D4TC42_RHISA|nr:hypothetical protein HPB52_023698 [Rhipicephalus sanguineus]